MTAPDEPAEAALDLPAVLDALAAGDVSFDLDRGASKPTLVFDPPLSPAALELLEPWTLWLTYVALGRYTRHAPAICERCAAITLAPTVKGADGYRVDGRCPMCHGPRSPLGDSDLRRRKPRRRPRPRLRLVGEAS